MNKSDRLLDQSIIRAATEPWYVSSRASQKDRYRQCLRLIKKHCPSLDLAYDVGCAHGQFAAKLAGLARRVVGIDKMEDRIATNSKTYEKVANLTFRPGNFLDLDLPGEKADLLVALEIFYYLKSHEQHELLQKAKKVLKPGGYLLVSTNVLPTLEGFSEATFKDLVQQYFVIRDTQTIYRGLYYGYELPLIRLMDEINYLKNLRIFTPYILGLERKFYRGIWNTILLRPSWTLDRVLLPLGRQVLLGLLANRPIFWLLTTYAKTFCPEQGRSQIILLAQKNP